LRVFDASAAQATFAETDGGRRLTTRTLCDTAEDVPKVLTTGMLDG
jgi:hypothetical protein